MQVCIIALCLCIIGVCSGANTAVLVLLQDGIQDGARCLDGSSPAYYIQKGWGTGQNKWQIHHEGGGWCTSLSDCVFRSTTDRGSSLGYTPTMELLFGYLSNNATLNPMMYNWNKVYLKYCDGASFSGNNNTVTIHNGTKLYFRGFLNLQAYFSSLTTNYGLKSATDIVIGGCSAGGLATYLHLDWWKSILPNTARVVGFPDSGFFLDYNSKSGKPAFSSELEWTFNQNNATMGVNQACIEKYKPLNQAFKCIFAEHTAPFVKTPLFGLQSEYDSWQTANILGSTDAGEINTYGNLIMTRFKSSVLSNPNNGVFLDSCYHHCHGWELLINGENVAEVFQRWYESGNNGVEIQGKSYPCTDCCTNLCKTC